MSVPAWKQAGLAIAIVLLSSNGATGCAEQRPAINRVQANALAKSFFLGPKLDDSADDPEFYTRGTIVDVGFGAAQNGLFQSTYAQPITRIRWEITETLLNARLAYDRIEGTDSSGSPIAGYTRRGTANPGQIVASFKIQSHFDIRRDYNDTTGEERNVVVENTSDRVWNQREYMRVDWSRNLITSSYDFDTLSQLGIRSGVEYEPTGYYVNDPNHPDAPFFDPESGYFDITTKVFAKPALLAVSIGGEVRDLPACFLSGEFAGGTSPIANCNATEITVRQSWKRVDDNDYEQVTLDGVRFQAFGIFDVGFRYGYERNYGLIDNRWLRFAARYNLYERSHYYDDPETMTGAIPCATLETTAIPTGNPSADPNRDEDHDGTADECAAAGPGSRCNVYKSRCTLPYAERQPITIPWYIGGGDSSLFEATEWAVEEWDVAMKTAIQTARLVECRRTGGQDCAARFPMWRGQQDDFDDAVAVARDVTRCLRRHGWNPDRCESLVSRRVAAIAAERGDPDDPDAAAIGHITRMQPVIVLCHNPVIAIDHPVCGEENRKARLGDLRWHSVLVIDEPQSPSAWGIMADADDPLSGEKVATSVNVWSHATDTAAQNAVDVARYMNGELTTAEITDGSYVREWAQANKLAAAGAGPTMSREEVASRLAAATAFDRESYTAIVEGGLGVDRKEAIAPLERELSNVRARADIPSPQRAAAQARMAQARGTPAESTLMNTAMLELAGIPPDLPLEGAVRDLASPLALNNPRTQLELRAMHDQALADRGACILREAPEPSGMPGLAEALARKFPAPPDETKLEQHERVNRMFQYVRRRFHYAVIAHEMGHSIGLRHNFVSNTAPLFFRPQYWQLRTRNGQVTAPCTGTPDEDPRQCVGPRYYDAVTDEEQSQLIAMYQSSTVMDYPGDVSQDMIGLGVYDLAAARFFYGDVISVYDGDDPRYLAGREVGTGLLRVTDTFGGLAGIKYGVRRGDDFERIHYSQLHKEYNLLTNCYPVKPEAPATWNERIDGKWDPTIDGKLVTIDGVTKRCRQQPVDYVAWDDLRLPTEKEVKGAYDGGPAVHGPTGRVRVPYSFATDHWADTGNASVFRHDQGADPYEQVMFLLAMQENRHVFDNYRRHRTTFTVRAAARRSFERYSEKMVNIGESIGLYATRYRDLATNQGLSFDTLWPHIVDGSLRDNVIAATVAFDQLARQLSRPHVGGHYLRAPAFDDPVLRSDDDPDDYGAGADLGGGLKNSPVLVDIPNGSTGYAGDVGYGGRPLHNGKAEDQGDFNTEYTMWAGSYYDKINTAILLSESEDRFVSSARRDFYDARFRAVGMADVLPEGFRRLIANALTGDRSLLAPQIASRNGRPAIEPSPDGEPGVTTTKYPARPLGWKSWWPQEGPAVCFPREGMTACFDYLGGDFNPAPLPETMAVDPQVGWEEQKFLIAWTLAYLPANQKSGWLDMMRIYRLGEDADPQIEARIEWEDPSSGQVYVARTYGKECLFGSGADRVACEASGGKWAEKGIAARVLQWANHLTAGGYALDQRYTPGNPDPAFDSGDHPRGFNRHGRPMVLRHPSGEPIIVPDPAIKDLSPDGTMIVQVQPCDQNVDPGCTPLTVYKNHYAYELTRYKSVPDYLREMRMLYGIGQPTKVGVQ